jgi:hypothetical protein
MQNGYYQLRPTQILARGRQRAKRNKTTYAIRTNSEWGLHAQTIEREYCSVHVNWRKKMNIEKLAIESGVIYADGCTTYWTENNAVEVLDRFSKLVIREYTNERSHIMIDYKNSKPSEQLPIVEIVGAIGFIAVLILLIVL